MEDASLVELVPTEMKYEVFVAKQIGELIAAAPELNFIPERELPRTLLIQCAESFFDGNMYAFARFFGLGKKAANSLWKKTPFSVDIELLLKIAFKVGVSLTDLLTKDNAIADFTPTPPLTATGNRLSPRRKKKNVLRVLMEALIETPPPSLNDLAERLGYSGGETLRRYFPEVCDQLKENYLKSARGKEKDKPNFIRLQNDEVIKLALESALNEANVPSLGQVARSLGYTSSLSQRS